MPRPTERDACDPVLLAELVLRGDSAALDRMTRCYGARLLRAGRRHCRTAEEAEDAVQDTLLIAANQLGSFRGEGSLEGWLVHIVAHACRRLGRGHKNDAGLHDPDAELADPADSPEALTGRREVGDLLNDALLALSPEDRLIVLLFEVEGRSGDEIAKETGLSPGAVRTRLTRIRARLREVLSPAFEDSTSAP